MGKDLKIFLCRHGETPWSKSGQHTGSTDLELTDKGKIEAKALSKRLKGISFAHVFSSPMRRSLETCELAGLEDHMRIMPELVEWDYGEYEGLTSDQIHQTVPDWTIFTHGAPGGESPQQIMARASGVIEQLKALTGNVAIFSHGHFLRVLGACWIGLTAAGGAALDLSTASLSVLSHYRKTPALAVWNETWFHTALSQ